MSWPVLIPSALLSGTSGNEEGAECRGGCHDETDFCRYDLPIGLPDAIYRGFLPNSRSPNYCNGDYDNGQAQGGTDGNLLRQANSDLPEKAYRYCKNYDNQKCWSSHIVNRNVLKISEETSRIICGMAYLNVRSALVPWLHETLPLSQLGVGREGPG